MEGGDHYSSFVIGLGRVAHKGTATTITVLAGFQSDLLEGTSRGTVLWRVIGGWIAVFPHFIT